MGGAGILIQVGSPKVLALSRVAILSSKATLLWGDFVFHVIREMYWCARQPSWTGSAKPAVWGG